MTSFILLLWSSFVLSGVDTVTTGTKSLVSVIANLPAPVELIITQVDDHVKIELTSQLIKGILRVFQKEYFIRSISCYFYCKFKWFRICCYYLAHLCNIAINFQMFLNSYHYILSNYTLVLLYQYLQHYLFMYYFTSAFNKQSTIFKYYTFISFICFCSCSIISWSSNCYFSCNKYVCTTIITQITF